MSKDLSMVPNTTRTTGHRERSRERHHWEVCKWWMRKICACSWKAIFSLRIQRAGQIILNFNVLVWYYIHNNTRWNMQTFSSLEATHSYGAFILHDELNFITCNLPSLPVNINAQYDKKSLPNFDVLQSRQKRHLWYFCNLFIKFVTEWLSNKRQA